MERIKGVRQKTGSGQYSSFVPFGTDGEFVEMSSELNLEYELKLGPKHAAQIIEDEENDITYIIQEYAAPEEAFNKGSQYNNLSFYRTKTKISAPNRTIIPDVSVLTDLVEMNLYWISRVNGVETEKFIKGKETQILTITVVPPEGDQPGVYRTDIEERYYTTERDVD